MARERTRSVAARRLSMVAMASVVFALASAACSAGPPRSSGALIPTALASAAPGPSGPNPSPKPQEQWFSPPYGAAPPSGGRTKLRDARLSADHRTITVTFVGASGYQPTNPCSADYAPWVGLKNGVLQVVVVETVPFGRPPVGTGNPVLSCTLVGYGYVFHLDLPEPYDGAEVDDQAGTKLWVGPPPGLTELGLLPTAWALQAAFDEPSSSPSLYVRVYAAAPLPVPTFPFPPDVDPAEGPGRLFVYQAFGAPVDASIGDPSAQQIPVEVHGATVILYHRPDNGEFFMKFVESGDGIALDAFDADFTSESLVAIANGMTQARSTPILSP